MSSLSERIAGCKIDRRAVLAATGASVAGLALAGCSPQGNALQEADEEVAAFESEGKWVPDSLSAELREAGATTPPMWSMAWSSIERPTTPTKTP